jgi:hypothetical protein
MAFDPKFARDVLLPLSVHAYTVAGIPHPCESLDTKVFKAVGVIEVDPAKCREVWSRLQSEAARIQRTRRSRQGQRNACLGDGGQPHLWLRRHH